MTNTTDERRAVLWDVDGTLIDSSEYHWLSWRDALAAEDFPVTREQFAATFGQRNDEILRAYSPRRTSSASRPQLASSSRTRPPAPRPRAARACAQSASSRLAGNYRPTSSSARSKSCPTMLLMNCSPGKARMKDEGGRMKA